MMILRKLTLLTLWILSIPTAFAHGGEEPVAINQQTFFATLIENPTLLIISIIIFGGILGLLYWILKKK